MDWFEQLVGFEEADYAGTRAKLKIVNGRLVSTVNGASYKTGRLELISLADLREKGKQLAQKGRLKIKRVVGDVRRMHRDPDNNGALFQVASQFNLLEMVDPSSSPEDGVTCYRYDRTQGPACAIAAGAATIYRNYFAPTGTGIGQRADRQINALHLFGNQIANDIGLAEQDLWVMQNGYALPSKKSLNMISAYLSGLKELDLDRLRCQLQIGIHWDVEATEAPGPNRPIVSQAFCSAMPVSYSGLPSRLWEPLGPLILEAAYEATLWAGAINPQTPRRVYLTRLGGGAFGNPDDWICKAIQRAIVLLKDVELDVRLVNYQRHSRMPGTQN